MALPPGWKIRREINRITDRTGRFVGRVLHDPIRKPIYDLTAKWRQRVTPGQLALTDRVAVFVIYQPKGIAGSILLTLQHLHQNHYSVLLVSNGPLRAEDRATLAQHSAVVLERPNVGYDFGAYRDGIRHLWSLNHDLSRLVLMNDSTWFPLRRDDDSLARMEALGADLAGHIFKSENKDHMGHDHVESHLLMVSHEFLNSKDFRSFWSRYSMSDNRATTIKLGEKGFSQMAMRTGKTIGSLMGRDWLLSTLRCLDEDNLRDVLEYTIDSFRGRQRDASEVRWAAANGKPWREPYLQWVDESLSSSLSFMISATFVMPALIYGRMGFAKKANDIRFHLARCEVLNLEKIGRIEPIDPAVRDEIKLAIQNWQVPRGLEAIAQRRTSIPIPMRS